MGLVQKVKETYHKNNVALYRHLVFLKGFLGSFLLSARSNSMSDDVPIDFVVTWVDGNDVEWQREKNLYFEKEHADSKPNSEARYRDWGLFKYWFRSVEKYARWVNNIYLVTCGHYPEWLNRNHPKLKIVSHSDFIDPKYLPTFNSNVIEFSMHRIPGLSEHFVYFNDDMFLARPAVPTDFFVQGLPKITSIIKPVRSMRYPDLFQHELLNVAGLVNQHFDPEICMIQHPEKWFCHSYGLNVFSNFRALKRHCFDGFPFPHLAVSMRKRTICKVWSDQGEVLDECCSHRFRRYDDLMHQLFSVYEMVQGSFYPVSSSYHGRYFSNFDRHLRDIDEAFACKKYLALCLNDNEDVSRDDFVRSRKQLSDIMDRHFPEKSSFEI